MSKTLAEVLAEHRVSPLNEGGWFCVKCNYTAPSFDAAITHQAAALSAAGFGLVADAKTEARREAAIALMGVNEHESRMPGIRFAVGFLSGQKRGAS